MRRSHTLRSGIVAALLALTVPIGVAPANAEPEQTTAGCWQQFAKPAQPQISQLAHGGDGSLWAMLWVPQQGFQVGRWNGSGWTTFGGAQPMLALAVTPTGQPWMVTGDFNIYRLVGTTWEQVPGQAYNLDIGRFGDIWKTGPEFVDNGHSLYVWNGTGWTPIEPPRPYGALDLAVDRFGSPWIISGDKIFRRKVGINGGSWQEATATPGVTWDLDIGGHDSPLYGEQMWRIIWAEPGVDFPIQRWNPNVGWVPVEGAGQSISIDREGRAWHVNSRNDVFFWACA